MVARSFTTAVAVSLGLAATTLSLRADQSALSEQQRESASSALIAVYPGAGGYGRYLNPCADFGADGYADFVWQHPDTEALVVTYHNPQSDALSLSPVSRPLPFHGRLMGIGCMDGQDGWPDLILQDPLDQGGAVTIVRMRYTTPIEAVVAIPQTFFQVVATADFDRDNNLDLVLQAPGAGMAFIQYMKGTFPSTTVQLTGLEDAWMRIVAAVDLDGNGHPDLVWQNLQTGEVRVSLLSGPTTQQNNVSILASTRLRVVAANLYGLDATKGLLMQDPRTGEAWVLDLKGYTAGRTRRVSNPTRWRAMSLAIGMNIAVPPGDAPPASATRPAPVLPDLTKADQVGNRLVKLAASHSLSCLEVSDATAAEGAAIRQAGCRTSSAQQVFWLTPDGKIVSALGRVLTISGNGNGAMAHLASDVGDAGQRWRFSPVGSGRHAIVNVKTGRVLDVRDASTRDGADIQQWAFNNGTQQRWELLDAPAWTATTTTAGLFRVVAQHSGKCLDLPGATNIIGTQLQQYDCLPTLAQTFWSVPTQTREGASRIVTSTGNVLDVSGASRMDGAPVIQWSWNGESNQKWLLLPFFPDAYYIVSAASGKALDVEGGPAARENGRRVQQWTTLNGANQRWRLERIQP